MSKQKTQGQRMVTRAAILCKTLAFQRFCYAKRKSFPIDKSNPDKEGLARFVILDTCKIYSRSELATNTGAQERFQKLDNQYKSTLDPIKDQYTDNLSRY